MGIEYIPQGVFILTSPIASHYPDHIAKVTITGQDQWYLFSGNFGRLTKSLKLARGQHIRSLIKTIVSDAGITNMLLEDCDKTLPYELNYSVGDSLGDIIKDLVAKCYVDTDNFFYEAFFDANGYFRFQKVAKPGEIASCWTYQAEDITMYAGSERALDDTALFNHILVFGGTSATGEFHSELVVDETAHQCTWYRDTDEEDFKKGRFQNMEATYMGRLQLLETKESITLEDGSIVLSGTGVFASSGSFTSRWFFTASDYTYLNSSIHWIAATKSAEDVTQTVTVSVQYSNDASTVLGTYPVTSGEPLPNLSEGQALPTYVRYQVEMTSSNSGYTPRLTNLKFSITVNHTPWAGHPYAIQHIGDRMQIWKDGIDGKIDSQAQCDARAQYELERNLAYTETVTMSMAPNYLHEGNDVIEIHDPYNGCNGRYQLRAFSVPIRPQLAFCTAEHIRRVLP